MTILYQAEHAVAARSEVARVSRPLAIAAGCFLSFVLSWPHLRAVWETGTFFDTDDAMRMVEVRDWLAGQSWFDLRQMRVDPPHGLLMHWSRLIDLPLGVLVRASSMVVSSHDAELLARIVFPLSCQVLLVVAFVAAAEALCGPVARLPAVVLIVLSGAQYGQFPAGRIDHHAPQIVLLVAMLACFVSAVRTGFGRHAGLCAVFMALSLGISLENLPFIAVLIGGIVVVWIVDGRRVAGATAIFGACLAASSLGVYIATVPPRRWLAIMPDALSAAHLALLVSGGVGLAVLSRSFLSGATWRPRLGAAAALGGALSVFVAFACPSLASGPYADVDPIARALWLDHVTEAMPLRIAMALHPQVATLILAPALLGLLAALAAARTGDRVWIAVTVLVATAIVGTCWEIRVASALTPLGLLGGVWVASRWGATRPGPTTLSMLAFALVSTPAAWAFVPVPEEQPSIRQRATEAAACRAADALAPLAGLAPALAFAPIDIGSHLLAHTSLSVLGAPYHRNNGANRTVLDGFLAAPEVAAQSVRATGARYVVICPGETQMTVLAETAPEGLAAHLMAGRVPSWLTPIALTSTPYRVYSVQP